VREYARGDSLRQIAWRLSARSGRLLVKDFEKSVNTDVTLCLNMCTHEQIGGRAASTWECAKNAALAVLSQQISEGNCVQLLSNGMSIPFGNTREHVELVTRSIFALKPGRPPHDSRELLGWAVARTPPSSTFIYVAPHFSSVGDDTVRQLLALRARNIQVLALLVDPRGFAAEVASGALVHYVHAELARAEQLLKRSVGELEAGGIQTYVIARGQSIGAALVGRRPVEA
jgi:uncharacterized protein (DUF58 family)